MTDKAMVVSVAYPRFRARDLLQLFCARIIDVVGGYRPTSSGNSLPDDARRQLRQEQMRAQRRHDELVLLARRHL